MLEVKTCIALRKKLTEARYSGPLICTFCFKNFSPFGPCSLTLASCTPSACLHILARRVLPTQLPLPPNHPLPPPTDIGPGTSQDFTAAVPGLFVHYSAMHKNKSLNYLNLAMISESL